MTRTNRWTRAMLAGLAMAAAIGTPPALAAEDEDAVQHVPALGAGFAQQRAAIEAEMEEGGRYSEIGPAERELVLRAFDTMERIIGDAEDVHDLTPEQRAELMNVQGLANTTLTSAHKESRVRCKRMKVTGSRVRATTVCHTVGHWRRLAEASQEDMRLRQGGLARDPTSGQ